MAEITIDESWRQIQALVAHAEASGYDPGNGEARSSFASTLLQGGSAVVWPPGRNEPC